MGERACALMPPKPARCGGTSSIFLMRRDFWQPDGGLGHAEEKNGEILNWNVWLWLSIGEVISFPIRNLMQ